MILPNFLIIGAAKSGTTSLYHYLSQHPEVFMPTVVKEPNFFSFYGENIRHTGPGDNQRGPRFPTIEAYAKLFESADGAHAIGEATTRYLSHELAAERIHRDIPDVKLIALLRHPVDRAYSNWVYFLAQRREYILDFEAALAKEDERIQMNYGYGWRYRSGGYYYQQLCRYFDLFNPDQIRIYLFEDLTQNPETMMRDIYAFLGVDSGFRLEKLPIYNSVGIMKNQALLRLYARVRENHLTQGSLVDRLLLSPEAARLWTLNQYRPKLDKDVRRRLTEHYRDEIIQLERLIHRDLSHWLT